MKTLILTFFFSLTLFALPKKDQGRIQSIPHDSISFLYQDWDGTLTYKCKHYKVGDLTLDWRVVCGDKKQKEFTVHLKISRYTRPVAPKNSYEVLYWITNKTNNYEGSGTTTWFHFNEDTSPHSMSFSQSTDDDTAGLYLRVMRL